MALLSFRAEDRPGSLLPRAGVGPWFTVLCVRVWHYRHSQEERAGWFSDAKTDALKHDPKPFLVIDNLSFYLRRLWTRPLSEAGDIMLESAV